MPRNIITRQEILRRLNEALAAGKPIIGAGCSAGIIAKCAEAAGADLIIAYSTGKSRLMGLPTSQIGDSNTITLSMCEELQNVVRDTPIIGGVEGVDPRKWDLRELISPFLEVGYSGIINFPTIGLLGEQRIAERESVGLGFTREAEMMRVAHEMDLFTMAYVFSPRQAETMAEANIDCLVSHVRGTAGGLVGYKEVLDKEQAATLVQEMIDAAKSVNSKIICLARGGPFSSPTDTEYLYEHTDARGFVGASSIERIPIEKAVTEVVSRFKTVSISQKKV